MSAQQSPVIYKNRSKVRLSVKTNGWFPFRLGAFLGASDEPLRFAAGSRANRCFLRESVVLTKRQQHDVGHEGIVTGRDALSLRSFSGGSGSTLAHRKLCSARKRSVSDKCFICAKAKRQQQMFYLCESEASATNVLSVRKRSVSNKCFICAKAKRQQQSE